MENCVDFLSLAKKVKIYSTQIVRDLQEMIDKNDLGQYENSASNKLDRNMRVEVSVNRQILF